MSGTVNVLSNLNRYVGKGLEKLYATLRLNCDKFEIVRIVVVFLKDETVVLRILGDLLEQFSCFYLFA